MRTGIVAVILTKDEEKHIGRCIQSLSPVVETVFVVDSGSTDRTVEIAKSLGACVRHRSWLNYADQFQWALDNLPSAGGRWLMRMDADEYLDPELQSALRKVAAEAPSEVTGVWVRRKVMFMGAWMRFGGSYPQTLLRMWRTGVGRIEQRWMDEHIVLTSGKAIQVDGHIVDDNLKGITFWTAKHNSYASREMVDLLNERHGLFHGDRDARHQLKGQAKGKRWLKERVYAKLPVGFRASCYFAYRYIFALGFLDGGRGFLWHFLQGFWYRLLVDIKLFEVERLCGTDKEAIKRILREQHGIAL